MREMKDSGNMWIGATPETWKMIPLKYLASYNDEVLSENTDDEFEFDYIEIGSVQYGRGIIYTEHMKFKNAPSRARRIVRKDDIIVSTVRTYLKAVATIPACNNSLIASTGFIVIRPHKVLPRFMNYALLSESFISLVESHSTGISYPAINSVDVVKFKIPVPCRSEQERIAAFLDAECAEIDAVLEKTRASIEEYKKLKQAVITQAVTKGIRGDRPMKDSGIEWIGEIPVEWEIRKIFRAINKVGDIDHYMPDSVDDGIPYLMTGDLQEKLSDVNLKRCKKVSFQDYEMLSSKIRVSKGDVIFARYATIGTVCFVDTEDNILVSYACLIIKPNSSLLYGEFLFYYLKSTAFLEEIKQYIKANTQANVGLDSVSKAKIALPSVHEQQKIVEYLRDKCKKIDALIAKKQQYITEIENYKKSLIYEYVTGKKEVV